MQFLRPSTVAVYRAGFPSRSRHRQADKLVYHEMLDEAKRRLGGVEDSKAAVWISDQFVRSFGKGVVFSDPPKWAPAYDGATEVDISALLALYFLEEFPEKQAVADQKSVKDSPVPAASRPLGSDIIDYVASYGEHAPPLVMSQHLTALIGLRLFQLPLRIANATRHLIGSSELVDEMTDQESRNGLEQYVDFTGEKGGPSDQLARACVQRDLDTMRQFFWDRLYLRSIHEAAAGAPELRAQLDAPSQIAGRRLQALVESANDPHVEAFLSMQINRIMTENSDTDDEDAREFLDAVASSNRPPGERLADILVEALKSRGYENAVKWFWSTGGIKTESGILSGSLVARRSWSFAPSDVLLAALIAVIFARRAGGAPHVELPLEIVLTELETKFGFLVSRPPSGLDSAESRSAAASNLEAFKYRLQLLGAFEGLSDDFSAQRVRNPYAAMIEEM